MTRLQDGDDSTPPVDPAAIELTRTVSISIDVSRLLHSQASEPVKLDAASLDPVRELAARAEIAPLIGLVSRSVDFALGFLDLPHFRILVLLSEQPSISVAHIVDAMKMASRKVLALLDSMEGAGWIHTVAGGRGVAETVAITHQGRTLVEDVTTKRQGEIDEVLQRLSDADRAVIATAFSSFAIAAKEPLIMRPKNGIAK